MLTASGVSAWIGWGVVTPADAYSTGQSAESTAHTSAIATTRAATGRQRGEGSRPSGKQITAKVVRARATANGHTPSQPHQGLVPEEARVPDLAAQEHHPSTTPAAMNSNPSRCPGRWKST